MPKRNKYAGLCEECGLPVKPGDGTIERQGRRWLVYCQKHTPEPTPGPDRVDMAYEDQCAAACGLDAYGG